MQPHEVAPQSKRRRRSQASVVWGESRSQGHNEGKEIQKKSSENIVSTALNRYSALFSNERISFRSSSPFAPQPRRLLREEHDGSVHAALRPIWSRSGCSRIRKAPGGQPISYARTTRSASPRPCAVWKRDLRTRCSSLASRKSMIKRSHRRICRSGPAGKWGGGAEWSACSWQSIPGWGWSPAIWSNTLKIGGSIEAISRRRKSRKPWSTTMPSWRLRRQTEEGYDGS